MYNYDMICTYKMMDNDDDQKVMYQIQLLQLFNLDDYNDVELSNKIFKLYDSVKDNIDIEHLIDNHPYKSYFLNNALIFQAYFSFDTLDVFTNCLRDIKNQGKINDKNKDKILNIF